jgi:hypothetical protein
VYKKLLTKREEKKPIKIPNRLGLKLNKNSLKIAISGPPKAHKIASQMTSISFLALIVHFNNSI